MRPASGGQSVTHNLSFDALSTQTPFEATHRQFREELIKSLGARIASHGSDQRGENESKSSNAMPYNL
jgi:hypothetical protein